MSDPTIYFPSDLHYMMYESGLKFVDVVTQSASRRRQQVRNISGDNPLTKFAVKVFGFAGDSTTSATTATTTWQEFYDFMLQVKGRYRRFYLFDPKTRTWVDDLIKMTTIFNPGTPPPVTVFDNLPLVFPYKGGAEPVPDVDYPNRIFDQAGPGGEWRLTAADPLAVVEGTFNTRWTFTGANRRYAVRMETPDFDFSFDFNAVDPATEVTLSMIESDSDPTS